MRSLLSLFLFLCSFSLYASTYSITKSDYYPALDIYEVSQSLYSFGFYEIDLKRKGSAFNSSSDQIFLSQNSTDQLAILKLDLKYSSDQILEISETEFVCHAKTSRQRDYSLYIKGKSKGEFLKICKNLNGKEKSSAKNQLFNLFVNRAYAANSNCSGGTAAQAKSMTEIRSHIQNSEVIQGIGTCLSGFVKGAYSSATGTIDAVTTLLSNPLQLWNQLSEQAIAIKNFIVHLKDEVIKMKESFQSLDAGLIAQMACHFGGEVLVSAGLTTLGGAGAAKLVSLFSSALVKIKNMQTIFGRLNDLKKSGQAKRAEEILSCAVSSK